MESLDSEIMDDFLPVDYDLSGNVFEDEFMLDRITADACPNDQLDLCDETIIRGIQEELESWTGGSSVSSSPTFHHEQNASPDSSDEERGGHTTIKDTHDFLRDVVVNGTGDKKDTRDTPSPGSSSTTSSGCYSDFSCTIPDVKPIQVLNIAPGTPIFLQQPPVNVTPIQYVQIPSIVSLPGATFPLANAVPKPIVQIKPKPPPEAVPNPQKTIVLSQNEFGELLKKMKVTKQAPKLETQRQPLVTMPPHQLVNEKEFKKQQRMIRNRESANLSRRKKKEFVDSLQETIDKITGEKEELLKENNQLRTQLLNNVCSRCNGKIAISVATGRASIGKSRPLSGYVTKKNSVLVLAMLLTVSLNFGPLNNMLSSPKSPRPRDLLNSESADLTLRRHILWAEEESIRNDTTALNRSRRSTDSSTEFVDLAATNTNSSTHQKCSQDVTEQQFINQTENIRIASELRRWIGDPGYLNLTREVPSVLQSWREEMKRKDLNYDGNFLVNLMPKKYLKNRKLQQMKKAKKGMRVEKEVSSSSSGAVDVFTPPIRIDGKYAQLFEELRRKDDTFYVVSFTADHLMLPALAYNKSHRPKMSLMFPALGFNNESLNGNYVTMMQIDCEVLDTTLIQVREKLIPEHLRRLQNITAEPPGETKGNRSESNDDEKRNSRPEFGPQREVKRGNGSDASGRFARKPYFIENSRFDNRTTNVDSRQGHGKGLE